MTKGQGVLSNEELDYNLVADNWFVENRLLENNSTFVVAVTTNRPPSAKCLINRVLEDSKFFYPKIVPCSDQARRTPHLTGMQPVCLSSMGLRLLIYLHYFSGSSKLAAFFVRLFDCLAVLGSQQPDV